jgi:hypothetical protein
MSIRVTWIRLGALTSTQACAMSGAAVAAPHGTG